jgi:hypothetical protein
MKWLFFLVLAMVAVRLLFGRWPWEPGRAGKRSAAKVKARNLLGVGEGASRADIIEAHKRLVAQVHPDRGGTNEQVHEANSARDLLLGELARRNTERA